MTVGKATSARGDSDGPRVHVGAFGKHPGWDDHIDDIGLDTAELVAIKRILYVQGVGGNIDAGAWDALDTDKRLDGFQHLLLYDVGDAFLVARLWSSTDGKGRARYPMVVCVQCSGLPKAWALAQAAEALADIETRCAATTSAAEVIAILDQWRGRLRRLTASAGDVADEPSAPGPLARVADSRQWGGDREGIVRVLYQVEREMAAYHVGARREGDADNVPAAALLRVPSLDRADDPYSLTWLRLLRGQVDPSTPIMQIVPLAGGWVDLLVGEPDEKHLFCLRATPASVPLTTEVPYTIAPEFVRRVDDAIVASAAGADERVTSGDAAGAPPVRTKPSRRTDAGASSWSAHLLSRRVIWIALAAAALVALLIVLAALSGPAAESRPPPVSAPVPPPVDLAAWTDLCSAYYDWFGALDAALTDDVRARWRKADEGHVGRAIILLLDRADAEGVTLDPRRLVTRRGLSLSDLAHPERLPAELRAELASPGMAERVRRAAAVLEGVEAAIRPSGSDAGATALDELAAIAEGWLARGWTGAAAYARAHLEPIPLGPAVVASIDNAMAAADVARAAEARWTTIRDHAAMLAASDIAILQSFGPYAAAEAARIAERGRSDGAKALAARLDALTLLGGELAAFVEGDWVERIDRELVAGDPVLAEPVAVAELNDGTYRSWLTDVRSGRYDALDPDADPRRRWPTATAELVADIRTDLQRLEDSFDPTAVKTFADRLEQLVVQVDALRDLRWDQPHRQAVVDGFAGAEAGRRALAEKVGSAVKAAGNEIAAFVASLPEDVAGSDVVNEAWRRCRDDLCAGEPGLAALQRKIDALKAVLTAIDASVPPATVGGDGPADVLVGLTVAAAAGREKTLADLLASMRWADGMLIQLEGDAGSAPRQAYAARLDGLRRLGAEAGTAAALLADYRGLDEADAEGWTLRRLWAGWRADALYADPAVTAAVTPVAGPIADMAAMADTSDITELQRRSDAVRMHPALRRTLWRRLGAEAWPATAEQLRIESALRAKLAADYKAVADPARRRTLLDELSVEGRRRWRQCLVRARNRDAFEAVLRMQSAFDVDLSTDYGESDFSRLREPSRYHVLLAVLQTATEGEPAAMLAARDRFVANVRAHCPTVAAAPPLAGFLERLTALQTPRGDPAGDVETALGPRWTGTATADKSRVTFTGPAGGARRHTLVFVRLETNGRPAYVCTTEVPVGLVTDLFNADRDPAVFDRDLLSIALPEGRVATWRPIRGRMIPAAGAWMDIPQWLRPVDLYPDGQAPAPPSDDCPIQWVPPSMALAVARRLQCRFPTSAEWRAATDAAGAEALVSANLRDGLWLRQQQHMADKRVPAGQSVPWPDAGTFRPAGVGDIARGADAQPVTGADDGLMWFAPVGGSSPGAFAHLVGNVAEYVFDDPVAVETDLVGEATTTAAVAAFLEAHAGDLKVIGGSALSAPELWNGADRPFHLAYPVNLADNAGRAADVGFRLAFTAPAARPEIRLKRMLADPPYLWD